MHAAIEVFTSVRVYVPMFSLETMNEEARFATLSFRFAARSMGKVNFPGFCLHGAWPHL